jgi:hypothetical protein
VSSAIGISNMFYARLALAGFERHLCAALKRELEGQKHQPFGILLVT